MLKWSIHHTQYFKLSTKNVHIQYTLYNVHVQNHLSVKIKVKAKVNHDIKKTAKVSKTNINIHCTVHIYVREKY